HLGFIDDEEYKLAIKEPDNSSLHSLTTQVDAPYVAEMVRSYMVERYGNEAYTTGYKVYTTIDTRLQSAANTALRKALMDYDIRHGYRGREGKIDLDAVTEQGEWEKSLRDYPVVGNLLPALVLEVKDKSAIVHLADTGSVEIPWAGLEWAKRYINTNAQGSTPEQASSILKRGDIIRVQSLHEGNWALSQVPDVSGALVSIRADTGAIQALLGGFDFYHSKFNRAIQAERQPGSNFKPFIYSAALEKGFTAASMINDAPIVFDDPGLESAWRPENYSGKFFGPTRLRLALTKSRNLVSIRLLRSIGIPHAISYASKFGFDTEKLPRDLSLALGSGAVTPISIARGYAVFANGGYLIEPHFITRVEDSEDNIIFVSDLPQVCPDCEQKQMENNPDAMVVTEITEQDNKEVEDNTLTPKIMPAQRVVDARNVYIMTSIMRDVIQYGTGRKALQLGRMDLSGKTGTTNDQRDAWFSGFNRDVVTTAWVGFDKSHPLGNYETGAKAALPMWVDYMREALKDVSEKPLERPEGLVSVKVDPDTGLLAVPGSSNAIFETFRTEYVPTKKTTPGYKPVNGNQDTPDESVPETEQLF
ncbi:MAG: penicillin-binding transpeptidase domain-containing protein, partial [Gammaproteobacteria bacterium]|nr:penicillin-binding transpeptidase domain-containing protein [Gammaproteobacteria bacterium]